MKTTETKTGKKPMPNVFGVLKDYKGLIVGLLVCSIVVNGLNLVLPKIIARAVDDIVSGTINMELLVITFSIMSVFILIFLYIQNFVQTYASERVARDVRKKLSAKISKQDYVYTEQVGPEILLTNLTSDVDGIKTFVAQGVVILISSVLTIIGATILLITINVKLALAVLAILPLIGITFSVVFAKAGPLFKQSREAIDWLNKVINESILGSTLIRVLHAHSWESRKFFAANEQAKNVGTSVVGIFAIIIPVITFVSSLATVIILALGGHYVVLGTMSLGDFMAFNSYVSLLIFPIIMIGFISSMIAQAQASYNRISNVLLSSDPIESGTMNADLSGDIKLDHVSLELADKKVLKDISFHIKPKTKTAIIGPTAAGKTQLLYLLIGLTRPDNGTISYDDQMINDYGSQTLHRQIGFVFQDSIIFNTTLKENIAFATDITDEDFQNAVTTAELDEFIETLPEKMETIISERGTNLSGGQKQRIMLARALALNPKILLLDDFTARVDSATEQRILSNISKNYPGLTLVSVTQKIASVEHYDQIMVLMEGELIAEGTHTELMERSTEYVQIFDSQQSTNTYELHA